MTTLVRPHADRRAQELMTAFLVPQCPRAPTEVGAFDLDCQVGLEAHRNAVEDALMWMGVGRALAADPAATREVLKRIVERLGDGHDHDDAETP